MTSGSSCRRFGWGLLAPMLVVCSAGRAADLQANIHAADGTPVADAVITLMPENGPTPRPVYGGEAVMDQVHSTFVPHVLVLPVGTAVRFPNSDRIHHDVYSFSPAKTFELPLYKGMPSQPVMFDKTGVVVLGCNIHDWMLGYIDVVATPWYTKTDADGHASLTNVPVGKYQLILWQPDLDTPGNKVQRQVELSDSHPYVLELSVSIVPTLHSTARP